MSGSRTARALGTLAWLPVGFVLTILLAAAAPLALGNHSYTVVSGSMTPAVRTGDVVVTESISPAEAEVGQIVTFRDPEHDDILISHRAVSIDPGPKQIDFITQGDANTGREEWSVPADGEIGRVLYRVPALGFAASVIGSPPGRIGLVVVPALLLGLLLMRRIWTSDTEPVRTDERAV